MNRSVRFLMSVFCVAFVSFGACMLLNQSAQATGHQASVLEKQDLVDSDGDGILDYIDVDDDNDGVWDADDADPYNPDIWEDSQLPSTDPEPLPTSPPAPTTNEPAEAPAVPEAEVPAEPEAEVQEPAPVALVPVVAALPETGVGASASNSTTVFTLATAMVTMVLIGAGTQLLKSR